MPVIIFQQAYIGPDTSKLIVPGNAKSPNVADLHLVSETSGSNE